MSEYRIEKDLLGEQKIPNAVYWGVHTARAMSNFNISGRYTSIDLIKALAIVKKACAFVNHELGYLSDDKMKVILQSCDEIYDGKFNDQFVVDAMQGGAGTSTNMNINEVIANRSLELLGKSKGEYEYLNPIDDVNLHQSTNDVYPTALRIAIISGLRKLNAVIARTQGAFQTKEKEFSTIIKTARTQMQDAVPIILGQEFGAYGEAFSRDRWRTWKAEERVRSVNIGGTAVGTGMTAPREYIFSVIEKLREFTGYGLSRGENLVDATQNQDSILEVSAYIETHANNIVKVCNDLRLMHYLKEINLPSMQAGSSIMPSKINPVVCEFGINLGMKVHANHELISEAISRSTFEICEFLPIVADAILENINLLINFNEKFVEHIANITANEKICREHFENNPIIITAFVPYIGYEKCQELIQKFQNQNKIFREFLYDNLERELIDKVLSVNNLLSLGYRK